MKISMITPFPPDKEGPAEYSKMLVNRLNEKYNIDFQIIKRKYIKKCKLYDDCNYIILPIWENNLRSLITMIRYIIKFNPELIHLQYGPFPSYGGILGEPILLLLYILKLYNYPIIITFQSYLTYNNIKRIFNKFFMGQILSIIYYIYYYFIMLFILSCFNKILLLVIDSNSGIKKELFRLFPFYKDKIIETHNGILIPINSMGYKNFKLKNKYINKKILYTVGFIRRQKGYENLIKILPKLINNIPNILYVISGYAKSNDDKEYLKNIVKLVSNKSLNKYVEINNRYITNEEILYTLLYTDLFVVPYVFFEGPSGPLVLAREMGVKVLSTPNPLFMSAEKGGLITLNNKNPDINKIVEFINDSEKILDISEVDILNSDHNFDKIADQHYILYCTTKSSKK